MKNCLGIEIGHYRVKIAYMEHGELQTYVSERLETENQTDKKIIFAARTQCSYCARMIPM